MIIRHKNKWGTDGSDPHFITYVWYASTTKRIEYVHIIFHPIPGKTTSNEILNIIDVFDENNIKWNNCSDRTQSMSEHKVALQALIKKKTFKFFLTHCILHRAGSCQQ